MTIVIIIMTENLCFSASLYYIDFFFHQFDEAMPLGQIYP